MSHTVPQFPGESHIIPRCPRISSKYPYCFQKILGCVVDILEKSWDILGLMSTSQDIPGCPMTPSRHPGIFLKKSEYFEDILGQRGILLEFPGNCGIFWHCLDLCQKNLNFVPYVPQKSSFPGVSPKIQENLAKS